MTIVPHPRPCRFPRETDGGFTLIELMIVVAIIAIITAVAIPSLGASRRAAREANVISTLRSGFTVNELFRQRNGRYANDTTEWITAGLLPGDGTTLLAGPDGYAFEYQRTGSTYSVTASPEIPGVTGDRWFFGDQTGVIRFSTSGMAGPASSAVE